MSAQSPSVVLKEMVYMMLRRLAENKEDSMEHDDDDDGYVVHTPFLLKVFLYSFL